MNAVYEPITITGYVGDIPYAKVHYPEDLPEPPKRVGYKGYWPEIIPESENIVIKAIYERVDFDILYHVGDDFFIGKYNNSAKIRFKVVPSRKGYKGYWIREDLDDGTIVMMADYEPIQIIGRVHGSEYARVFYPEKLPEPPSKIGYRCSWPDYKVYRDDITLDAEYSPVFHEIIYYVADEIYKDTYQEGFEFTIMDVPLISGYRGRWIREDLDDGTIIMVADYEPIQIIGYVDGSEYARVNYPYELPKPPPKVGYAATWPVYRAYQEDICLKAEYTIIDLEVRYYIEGEVQTSTYRINSEFKPIDLPPIVGKKGHWKREDLDDGTIVMTAVYEPVEIIGYIDGLEFARVNYLGELPPPLVKDGYKSYWEDGGIDSEGNYLKKAVYKKIRIVGEVDNLDLYSPEELPVHVEYHIDDELVYEGYCINAVQMTVMFPLPDRLGFTGNWVFEKKDDRHQVATAKYEPLPDYLDEVYFAEYRIGDYLVYCVPFTIEQGPIVDYPLHSSLEGFVHWERIPTEAKDCIIQLVPGPLSVKRSSIDYHWENVNGLISLMPGYSDDPIGLWAVNDNLFVNACNDVEICGVRKSFDSRRYEQIVRRGKKLPLSVEQLVPVILSCTDGSLPSPHYRMAFIGAPGGGKTTVICNMLGLLMDDIESLSSLQETTLLKTAEGRTTAFEVHITKGNTSSIEVKSQNSDEISKLLRYFSNHYYGLKANDENQSSVSEEVFRVIRNKFSLPDPFLESDKDEYESFLLKYATPEGLFQYLSEKLEPLGDVLYEYDGSIAFDKWLSSLFNRINSGLEPGIFIVKRMNIVISSADYPIRIPFGVSEIIDTVGLDDFGIRDDLYEYIEDPFTICVFIDDVRQVPSVQIRSVLELVSEMDSSFFSKISILANDRNDYLAAVPEAENNPLIGERIKKSQIEIVMRNANIPYLLKNTLFVNPCFAYDIIESNQPEKDDQGHLIMDSDGYPIFSIQTSIRYDSKRDLDFYTKISRHYCTMIYDHRMNLPKTKFNPLNRINETIEKELIIGSTTKSHLLMNILDDSDCTIKYYSGVDSHISLPKYWFKSDNLYLCTSIDRYAFEKSSIVSIVIPSTIRIIQEGAFKYCRELKELVMSVGVEVIRHEAFLGCSSLTSLSLPISIKEVECMAFAECTSLEELVIPESIVELGRGAFFGCSSLKKVIIPDSIVCIPDSAFSGCISLINVSLSNSIKTIGSFAFLNCRSLRKIIIPDSVVEIGKHAFDGCISLCEIIIPAEMEIVSELPSGTRIIRRSSTNEYDDSMNLVDEDYCMDTESKMILDEDPRYGFCHKTSDGLAIFNLDHSVLLHVDKKATSMIIPNSTKVIGNRAFSGCISLKKIVIPDSVTDIGRGAFYGCISLETVELPDSISVIQDSVFSGCTQLKDIHIPNSVSEIGRFAFSKCTSLEKVVMSESVKIGKNAFEDCNLLKVQSPGRR